jgi:hypothetical protein
VRHARTRGLEVVGAVVLALLLGLFVLGFGLGERGRAAMQESDAAFHRGDLAESVRNAERALVLYVPASAHVREAEERLVSIARGAEAEKNWQLARRSWEALRVGYERTWYPGRPRARYSTEIERAVARLDQQLTRK